MDALSKRARRVETGMKKLIWCALIVGAVMYASVEAMADTGADGTKAQASTTISL